jgi:hypothetical protein
MRRSRMNAVRRTEYYCVFRMPERTSGTTRPVRAGIVDREDAHVYPQCKRL